MTIYNGCTDSQETLGASKRNSYISKDSKFCLITKPWSQE